MSKKIKCAYCGRSVIAPGENESPPGLFDNMAWTELSEDHEADCKWILTRAHKRQSNSG